MHDPYLLLGMKEAVPRIQQAIEREEHILIYGDYDADGVSSTSLMIHLMRYLGASYDIYIPHRSNEGYGLHNHALDWAHQQGVTLVITVDTGISAVEQIAYASTLGMEVIVTDHHEPPEVLPEAYTLINPKLPDCPYPFKGLAGAGVALKLAQALIGEVPGEWMEIAAIGTVADLMPLEGENRVIVSYGIESMRGTRLPGVSALLEISGVDQSQVTSINIAFAMAPRINASGRLDHAGRAVSLLTTENLDEAHTLAGQLDLLNRERQQVVEGILLEATAQLEQKIQLNSGAVPDVIVLAGEGWNVGVVGIVASKLLERYYRPTLILGIDPESGACKGSARSIEGLDIYEALTACKHTMDHYGGHPAAAGMSLHRDQLKELEAGLNEFAASVLTEEDFVPHRLADDECRVSDVPLQVIQEIDRLQPFGMSNPSPRFVLRNVTVKETRTMGREKRHLKLVLEQDGQQLETVAFGKGALAEFLPPGTIIDVMERSGCFRAMLPRSIMGRNSFKDITTLLKDGEMYRKAINELKVMVSDLKIDVIAGPEARGFVVGAPLAYALGVGFAPIRKSGKLPGETIEVGYDLEYGKDTLAMHTDAIEKGQNVLIADDLLATGGTIATSINLIEQLGGKIVGAAFLIELSDLNGRAKLPGIDVFTLMNY
ncbi:hypothetical protein G195_004858 [Phytophthora kernoviae 00238/432]|uniref:Single-stranded-DNA-specific exonuclease RecJ n=1 Tax=Phytophthora kernoviae 00238/432 TaxID=1284355 RepID=A0A8J4SJ24_9STRA|nr:hypothetical protein G195_004858 [Phytophthora kernoviae 00238/432]